MYGSMANLESESRIKSLVGLRILVELTEIFDKMADTNGKTRMFHVIMYIIPRLMARCADRTAQINVTPEMFTGPYRTYTHDFKPPPYIRNTGTATFGDFLRPSSSRAVHVPRSFSGGRFRAGRAPRAR